MVSPVAVRLRQNRPGASPVPNHVETSRHVLVTDPVTVLHPQEPARDIDIMPPITLHAIHTDRQLPAGS